MGRGDRDLGEPATRCYTGRNDYRLHLEKKGEGVGEGEQGGEIAGERSRSWHVLHVEGEHEPSHLLTSVGGEWEETERLVWVEAKHPMEKRTSRRRRAGHRRDRVEAAGREEERFVHSVEYGTRSQNRSQTNKRGGEGGVSYFLEVLAMRWKRTQAIEDRMKQ